MPREHPPLIVCAAHRHSVTGRIVCGPRHHDALMKSQFAAAEGIESWKDSDQGFVDQYGRFWVRELALTIAVQNCQIRRRCGGDDKRLFSENLY